MYIFKMRQRYNRYLAIIIASVVLFLHPITDTHSDEPTDGLQVFLIDGAGNEIELVNGVTFKVDGSGGKGTRVTVEFSDLTVRTLAGREVILKRKGTTIAKSTLAAISSGPSDQGANLSQQDKQQLAAVLQGIHQREWQDLQTLHEEEIADFQKEDRKLQEKIGTVVIELNSLLEEQRNNLDAMQNALQRHEQDRQRLNASQAAERKDVHATLFGNDGNSGLPLESLAAQLSSTLGGTANSGNAGTGNTGTPNANNGNTSTGNTNVGGEIATSVSRQGRGKFNNFNELPVAPLAAGTPRNFTPAINRAQEDAKQEAVRAIFVIAHFDHVAEHTDDLFAGAPGGAARSADGRQLAFFPVPVDEPSPGVFFHPEISNGGSKVRFQKFVRELPVIPVYRPVDISPVPLNTEALRRAYSPSRWGAEGVGQVYHGIAPEYWQHASDWEQKPTLFFERLIAEGKIDMLGCRDAAGNPVKITTLWGFADGSPNADPRGPGQGNITVPGPCFIGRFAEPFVVRDINFLPHRRSTHLHGAHSPSHSDGSPHFFIEPGKSRDYYYPNIPPRAHDANLDILAEAADSEIGYEQAAAKLGIPLYVSKPGPAPIGDDPPGGWPNESIDGTPARVVRELGPLGGQAGRKWEMPDMTDTNWYHDHAMDETGPGVYSGLAGYYMTTDPTSEELMRKNVIPTYYPRTGAIDVDGSSAGLDFDPLKRGGPDTDYGKYFQIMSFSDKTCNEDGSLFYDVLRHDGQIGDIPTVNGISCPVLHVENRKYRFHMHGVGTARAWYLKLRNGDNNTVAPFMQIGYDAWFYEKPMMMDGLLLFVAKRRDVIVDFGDMWDRGIREVYIENCLPQIDGRGPRGTADLREIGDRTLADGEPGERQLKIIITDQPIHGGKPDLNIDLDTHLRENVRITVDEVVKTRILSFKRHNGAWTINNTFYDRSVGNITPTIGTAERWIIRNNGGGWWHPIHIHLEAHQWQKINGTVPHPSEAFWKQDTTVLGSNDEIETFMKFRTWLGPFVFHCHNLEHEDMRMMFNFDPQLLPVESPQQTQNLFP
ncbi:MAG TPA: hypothetical protein EYG57_11835 [Planctomycetes bacterium]|nr:hypothetical protein [Planctomycetota bacterium]